jgi:hypothetical protein
MIVCFDFAQRVSIEIIVEILGLITVSDYLGRFCHFPYLID